MATKKKITLKGSYEKYTGSNSKTIIDVINVFGKSATVRARNGNDIITIKPADKFIEYNSHKIDGGGGNDKITLKVGSGNIIYGGSGNDTIIINKSSKNEFNDIYGEAGNDTIIIKGGDNSYTHKVDAGKGNDTIKVSGGTEYVISGGKGKDTFTITGGGGKMLGGGLIAGGFNEFFGNADADTFIIKGGGDNRITGGSGKDKFIFSSSFKGAITINDYTKGEIIKFEKGANYSVSGGSYYDLSLEGKGSVSVAFKGNTPVPVTVQDSAGKIHIFSFNSQTDSWS